MKKVINNVINIMHQGDYIKARLKEIKITQQALADAIGVSRAQVIKVLSPRRLREDTIGTLDKILKYLEIDYTELPNVDDKISYVDDSAESYYIEKIEQLERLLEKEERLNSILEKANDQLASENKRLQAQLDKLSEKRESYHDNPGSSNPVQPAGKVAGGR